MCHIFWTLDIAGWVIFFPSWMLCVLLEFIIMYSWHWALSVNNYVSCGISWVIMKAHQQFMQSWHCTQEDVEYHRRHVCQLYTSSNTAQNFIQLVNAHTHTHTYTHIYIHTHIHTHIFITCKEKKDIINNTASAEYSRIFIIYINQKATCLHLCPDDLTKI